jgi:CheY-like chemotaxis protein/anti-sigma regulatory factor (Ser/Thr protein kinase)
MKLLSSVIPKTISIEINIEQPVGFALADPTELHQVVVNLCTNAYQAMSNTGGTLKVRLSETEIDRQDAERLSAGLEPGDYLKLMVEDSGCGMDGETLARIFEPYFTTKDIGKGTGLGLATVHGIVSEAGGAVTVKSMPGLGTTFSIYLPKYLPEADELSAKAAQQPQTGSGKVLFVDDEPSLARLGKRMLESLGYTVSSFTDPVQAAEIFESDPGGFDLVMTDQTMPGLTGMELIQRIKVVRPDMPAAICTGYSDLVDEASSAATGVAAFVRKPYDRTMLGLAASECLKMDEA